MTLVKMTCILHEATVATLHDQNSYYLRPRTMNCEAKRQFTQINVKEEQKKIDIHKTSVVVFFKRLVKVTQVP